MYNITHGKYFKGDIIYTCFWVHNLPGLSKRCLLSLLLITTCKDFPLVCHMVHPWGIVVGLNPQPNFLWVV